MVVNSDTHTRTLATQRALQWRAVRDAACAPGDQGYHMNGFLATLARGHLDVHGRRALANARVVNRVMESVQGGAFSGLSRAQWLFHRLGV